MKKDVLQIVLLAGKLLQPVKNVFCQQNNSWKCWCNHCKIRWNTGDSGNG